MFLVAEERRKIIGSVMGAWDGRRGWIYHLGVLPSHRRKGVASKLVRVIENRMRRKGVIKVNALIFEWNAASVKFFAKNGYEVIKIKEAGKMLKREKPKTAR